MTASDPFVSGTLDGLQELDTTGTVTIQSVMDKVKGQMFGNDQTRTFATADDGRYIQIQCSICDSHSLLSVPLSPTQHEILIRQQRLPMPITDQELIVERVRNQLPGWIIPMTFGEEIECSRCAEPEY